MADTAVGFLVNKLDALLDQEIRLLREVREEVSEIKDELESMRSFLKDADARKESEEGVKTWVKQVRNATYQVEDLVDEFMLRFCRLQEDGCMGFFRHSFHSIKHVRSRHDIATKIQIMKRRIDRISQRKDMYRLQSNDDKSIGHSTSVTVFHNNVDESKLVGIDGHKQALTNLLLKEDGPASSKAKPIAVWGKDGLGKTTLVSVVINSQEVQKYFECIAWVPIPQPYNLLELLKTMLRGLFKDREGMVEKIEDMNGQQLGKTIFQHLEGKIYLIVLDDMVDTDPWDNIKQILPRDNKQSRIAVTTPSSDVVKTLERDAAASGHSLEIKPLNDEDSMALFRMKAFPDDTSESFPPADLKDVCERMVKKCDGWPIAIKALGKAMSRQPMTKEVWEKVDQNIGLQLTSNPTLTKVRTILSLAYNELPLHLRPCFLYFSLFPQSYSLVWNTLIRLWIAEGFIEKRRGMMQEEVAEEYLNELIYRNLLQVEEYNCKGRVKTCRINDLMLNMVLKAAEEEDFSMVLNKHGGGIHEKARRLSIHEDRKQAIKSTIKMCHLRSLFMFGEESIDTTTLSRLFSSFKFLRVLVLENAHIERLPGRLGDLFHLRYLSLRGSNIQELPDSMGRLHNLQTLDIRETEVKTMPDETSKLENMRHLLMRPSIGFYPLCINQIRGVKVPGRINNMRKLKSVSGIKASRDIVKDIGSLFQLKKLEIFSVKAKYVKELCDSIQHLGYLSSLSIFCRREDEPLVFESSWHPRPSIRSLELAGKSDKLPEWLHSLEKLNYLGLFATQVKDESFSSLKLSSLSRLKLYEAYSGKELTFKAGCFPKLKELHLMYLNELETLTIENGAMPCLETIEICHCDKLKKVPHSIESITTLKELELVDMPEDFIEEGCFNNNKDLKITPISMI